MHEYHFDISYTSMVTILRNIVRACFDRTFYREAERDSFGRRYAHLYVLFAIIVAVFSIQIVGFYVSRRSEVDRFPQLITSRVNTFYPKDLVITFDKNELSINQPEPYVLGSGWDSESPDDSQDMSGTDGIGVGFQNLITIDTRATIDDFGKYDSLMLAMRKGVAVKQSERAEVRYYPYAEFLAKTPQPFTFDSVSYGQIVNRIRPFINQVPTLLVYGLIALIILLVLVGPLFLTAGVLFNILFLAIMGYLIAMVIGRKQPYTYIYKLGMYTAIPVIILQQIFGLISFEGLQSVWWLVALLLMVIFIPARSGAVQGSTGTKDQSITPPKIV